MRIPASIARTWARIIGRPASDQATPANRWQWRERLASGLSHVLGRTVEPADSAAVLSTLDTTSLARLDPQLRASWSAWTDGRSLPAFDGDERERSAFLFVAACSSSGYLRETALIALRDVSDPIASAIALIRCDDWVPQVREIAFDLLERIVQSNDAEWLFLHLDMLEGLRNRQRFRERAWSTVRDQVLLNPAFAELRWDALDARGWRLRQFAAELALSADPGLKEDVLKKAAADQHPRTARWALKQAATTSAGPQIEHAAISHRHPGVRAAALRACVERDLPASGDLIKAMLLDRAVPPRMAAAYFARNLLGYDPRDVWRTAFDTAVGPVRNTGLVALADRPEQKDRPRLIAAMDHDTPRVRAAALRGLARLASDDLEDVVAKGLRDPAPLVLRQAYVLAKAHGVCRSPALVRALHQEAVDATHRRRCIKLARLLDKWMALDALLAWYGAASGEETEHYERELRRWVENESSTFAPLSAGVASALREAIATVRSKNPSLPWDRIAFAVQSD